MSEFAALHVLLVAGEFLAISMLVAALAWLAGWNRSPGQRHLIWAVAFVVLLALPLLCALLPSSLVFRLAAPAPAALDDLGAASHAAVAAPVSFTLDAATIAAALIMLWLAGVGVIALRGLIAAFMLYRLKRDSVENPFEASELPRAAHLARAELRVSHAEHGPVTWGFLRPVILLPQRALYWPGERLHAVLMHELAHIRRGDSLVQMLSLAACALYGPNPFVWMAAARMRRDAEMATDDAVLIEGLTPSDYAGELLQIAAEIRARPLTAFTPMHMAAPSALESRVKSVLSPAPRKGVTKMDVLRIAGLALMATTALALARPSLAQDAPVPPPAPVATMPEPPAAPPAPPQAVPAPPAPAQSVPAPAAPVVKPVHNIAVREISTTRHGKRVHHMWVTVDGVTTDVDDALARARPQIALALAQVRANRAVLHAQIAVQARAAQEAQRALARVQPQIEAAMAQAQAELARANIDMRVRQKMDESGRRIQIQIDTQTRGDRTGDARSSTEDGEPDSN